MELCLGTVQFGMDYGVSGQKKPNLDKSIEMLDYATKNGVSDIDTANAYGDAEVVVGSFLKKNTINRDKIQIISKVKPNILDGVDEKRYKDVIKKNLEDTLSNLNTDYLDAYLFHSARYVFDEAKLDALHQIKLEGYVKQVGVSVYEPEEAKVGILASKIDFIQLPFSIFDQRMTKQGIFDLLNKNQTVVHSRSAFLQGLILMEPKEVPEFLKQAVPIVEKITTICKEHNLTRIGLAMQFVKAQNQISRLVFGVDNIKQLKEDIELFHRTIDKDLLNKISKEFVDIEQNIVMPSLWHKN